MGPAAYRVGMVSNLACIGLPGLDEESFRALVQRAMREQATLLGERDGHEVWRCDDPSGSRLVVTTRDGAIVDLLPTLAGTPGTWLDELVMLGAEVASAWVVDEHGEQQTALTLEVEERWLLDPPGQGRPGGGATLAQVVALGVRIVDFPDPQAYAASPASLLDPDAEPGPAPADQAGRELPGPPRLAAESLISYGVFAPPEQAQAYARLAGRVLDCDTRQHSLSGQTFHVARLRTVGLTLDLCLAGDGPAPVVGGVVAGTVFVTGTLLTGVPAVIPDPPRRRWWQRRN